MDYAIFGYIGYVVGIFGITAILWAWNAKGKMTKEEFKEVIDETVSDLQDLTDGIQVEEVASAIDEIVHAYSKYSDTIDMDDIEEIYAEYINLIDSIADIIEDADLADDEKIKYIENVLEILKK